MKGDMNQIVFFILLLLHPICYLLSHMLYSRCEFKTKKIKKAMMLKSVIANIGLNTVIIIFCLSCFFPAKNIFTLISDASAANFAYQDIPRLAESAFLCILLSALSTLLCCALYGRFGDNRVAPSFRQKPLVLFVLALAVIPLFAGIVIGSSGTKMLHITDVCRRYEVRTVNKVTGTDLPEDYSSVTLCNDGIYRNDVKSLYLSVEEDDLMQISIPAISLAPGESYTFELSDSRTLQIKKDAGSVVYLSDKQGHILDQVTIPALSEGAHYQKVDAGWEVINPLGDSEETVVVPMPVFSAESGLYDKPFELTLSAEPGLTVYYTLDCSDPDTSALLYTSPISIYDRSGEENVLLNVPQLTLDYLENTRHVKPVGKCMVVRAVAVDSDGRVSAIATNSYFIGEQWAARKDLCVLSVVSDPEGLVGPTGILVAGPEYDAWYQDAFSNTPAGEKVDRTEGRFKANLYQQGTAWEREADIQIFSDGKLQHQHTAGIRISGNSSRTNYLKRLSIYAREEYIGSNLFPYKIVNDAQQHSLLIRDGDMHAICQRLCAERDTLTVSSIPAVFFLNGELVYKGNIYEKFNETNIANKYGLVKDNLVLVKNGELPSYAQYGANPYSGIRNFLQTHDMQLPESYEEYNRIIDIQSYIDTVCINAYLANTDLTDLYGNTLLFHTIVPENQSFGDSRWRFGLIDMDLVWGSEISGVGKTEPWALDTFNVQSSWNSPLNEFIIFAALKVNAEFCRQFTLTYMDLINTIFTVENTTAVLDEMQITDNKTRQFFEKRAEYAIEDLAEEFELTGTVESVTLSSNRSSAPITINTVTPVLTEGVWSGDYFTDYPVTVTASESDFDHWEITACGQTTTSTALTLEVPVSIGGVQIYACYR